MAKNILLIGANSGIGLATAKLLQSQGATLTAASRSSNELTALGIPVQAFDAENPHPLDLPESLDGLIYFPGTITLKPSIASRRKTSAKTSRSTVSVPPKSFNTLSPLLKNRRPLRLSYSLLSPSPKEWRFTLLSLPPKARSKV